MNSGDPRREAELKRRLKRYWDRHSHSWLKHSDLLREEILARFPKDRLETDDYGVKLLQDLAKQQHDLTRQRWKLMAYGSLPIILLYLSIMGVQWRMSALGVELSDIKALKEIILLFATCVGFYSAVNLYGSYLIETTMQTIGETIYGKEGFEIFKLRLPFSEDAAFPLMTLRNKIYAWKLPYITLLMSWILSMILYIVLISVLSAIPYFYVLVDIWKNSHLPHSLGQILVGASLLVTILNFVFLIGIRFIKFRFFDVTKADELSRRSEQDIARFIRDANQSE